MKKSLTVRWKWLKAMYIYTIILPGITGLTVVFFPETYAELFQFQPQDPYQIGITGSMWFSFAILACFGFRSPLNFLPVLLFQLSYKIIWLSCVVLPLYVMGELSGYQIFFAIVMFTYVIGDLIAIPFPYVFAKEKDSFVLR